MRQKVRSGIIGSTSSTDTMMVQQRQQHRLPQLTIFISLFISTYSRNPEMKQVMSLSDMSSEATDATYCGTTEATGQCCFSRDGYTLSWEVQPDSEVIVFDLTHDLRRIGNALDNGQTGKWTGVWFGSHTSNLDMVIVQSTDHKSVKLSDSYSKWYGQPLLDRSQDIHTVYEEVTEDGKLRVKFVRKLKTGDSFHDKPLDGCETFWFPFTGGVMKRKRIDVRKTEVVKRIVCNVAKICSAKSKAQLFNIPSLAKRCLRPKDPHWCNSFVAQYAKWFGIIKRFGKLCDGFVDVKRLCCNAVRRVGC